MPRNKGTSRKGKPNRHDRATGLGKALQKSTSNRYRPRADGKNRRGEGGMTMQAGVESVGLEDDMQYKTKSVLELNDLDDFLIQADMAHREFVSEKEGMVVLDNAGQAYKPSTVRWSDQATDFVFKELSVPRRPAWNEDTTPEELHRQEQQVFLEWRRGIAAKEEELVRNNSSAAATPFEKNLEVWRQLWRVLERSSCLLQLVDARNPLFYLSDDLKAYAESLGKPMMVLVNKSDYLSRKQREMWRDYLTERGWDPVFFSAVKEQQKLDAAAQLQRREERLTDPRLEELEDEKSSSDKDFDDSVSEEEEDDDCEKASDQATSSDGKGVDVPLTREQLLETMLAFARQHDCKPDDRYGNRIQFGMVGFPNVGKSSVINVLVGSSKHSHGVVRVGVASQPGKTKHFQTLLLPDTDEMMLCDCPGLVFPSFVSNTADLIAAGVYPVSQMRDHWPVTNLICQRIPREILNAQYGIHIPVPPEQELRERGLTEIPRPTGDVFLETFCIARSMLAAASGVPDYTRAARQIIKDYADGKLLYCHPPPTVEEPTMFFRETTQTALQNTRKLREKLERQQKQLQQTDTFVNDNDSDDVNDEAGDDDDDVEFDDDLLELLGDNSSPVDKTSGNRIGKNKKGVKKWGKKGRKIRNKDPYGCHSTPDEQMLVENGSSGVIVNAGRKHGKQGGYTRPKSYAGIRAAANSCNTSE